MSLFNRLLKLVFFLVFFNNNIFCADKPEDGWTVLNEDNIKCEKFDAKFNGFPVYNIRISYIKLTEIPKFLRDYVDKDIIKNEAVSKDKYDDGYNISFYKYFKIVYNVFSNGNCIKIFEQDQTFSTTDVYRLLQEIVYPYILEKGYLNIRYYNFDFLDTDFYSNILNKTYFKKVKFKDGTLAIDVNVEELLKIVERHFDFSYKHDIERPFKIDNSSFYDADKKFFKKEFSNYNGFNKFYCAYIYYDDEMKRFERYFNFKANYKAEQVFKDGKYDIYIKYNIDEVNCNNDDKFNGELYPNLYYFYSSTIDNFTNTKELLNDKNTKFSWFFKSYMQESNFKNLLEEKELFHFYKVIESINLNEITKYSVFFQNIVYFIKNYVIPYEEKLLFEELRKIDLKKYLQEKKAKVEDFFYNKALEIIKKDDSAFKDFYTLFFYDRNKNKITGVYFDDLNEKKELKVEHVKLFSLKKLIDTFEKEYSEIDKKVNETLEHRYSYIDDSKSLKEQFINIIKDENIIDKNIEEVFLESKDFSFSISEYITNYCQRKIYKEKLESKDKNTLKSFIEKLNKKDDLFNEIKTKTTTLTIDKEYYEYFNKYELDNLINYMKKECLNNLSEIFVNEIIKNEKENIIGKFSTDNIATYIKSLQEKKDYYNVKNDEGKYTNIETLLNNKNSSEGNTEIKYKDEHINKIITELNEEINNKLEANKKTIINAFIESEKTKINAFKDLTNLNNYLNNFNKEINEDGSLTNSLKQNLISNNFKEDDIKNEDYKLLNDTLITYINAKQTVINKEMEEQMNDDNKKKLKTIIDKINEICNIIIEEIGKITKREDIKNYKYKDNNSITNHINEELVKIADYNTFIKEKIGKTDQTYEVSINITIGTKVTEIKNKYNERNGILSIVNIEYTLSDEDKITDEGKNEFNKLTDEKYKKFDSRKTYKELFGTLKSVSAYFKNIDLLDSSTLISIENKDEVIDKDNITINIKLVDSCYKKEKPKEEHKEEEEDKNKDKHNEDKHNENDKIEEEDIEDLKEGVKKKGCCTCSNNKKKTKKKGCCKK